MPGRVFLDMLEAAGFVEAQLLLRTGCKSSPDTVGAVFRCRRPG